MKSVDARLKKIETSDQQQDSAVELSHIFREKLPINNLQMMNDFEEFLTDPENNNVYVRKFCFLHFN